MQDGQRLIDGPRRRERAEVVALAGLGAAVLQHLRIGMVGGHQDRRKRLVVAQQDVVARLQALDQVGLEQQRLGLGVGGHHLQVDGLRDHAPDADPETIDVGVAGDPLPEVLRLADVERIAVGADHAVDAGGGRQGGEMALDDAVAGRCVRCEGGLVLRYHADYVSGSPRPVNDRCFASSRRRIAAGAVSAISVDKSVERTGRSGHGSQSGWTFRVLPKRKARSQPIGFQ